MIPTWQLIEAYLAHWQDLASTLGLSPVTAVAGASTFAVFTTGGSLIWIRHSTWVENIGRAIPKRVVCFAMIAASLVSGYRIYEAKEGLNIGTAEPVMLALNPSFANAVSTSIWQHSPSSLTRPPTGELEEYLPSEVFSPRNVILIVGDALRASRMSLFGHDRKTTPFLDAMHDSGNLHLTTRAHSICSESFCGLLGLSTARFVHQIPSTSPNLAQVLRMHGYRVELILGGDHTNFYGLADALGPYDSFWDGTMSNGYLNNDRAVLEKAANLPAFRGTPILMQFHLMSSHALGQRNEPFVSFSPVANYYLRHRLPADPGQAQEWSRNFYDNGVLQLDHTVKELLKTLENLGYLQNSIVVITSDHGEMLGEHGIFGHAFTVRQPALDIPLILMRFGFQGEPIATDRLPSQADVAPTILAELDIQPPAGWSGRALQGAETLDFSFFQQAEEIGLFDHRDEAGIWKFWINMKSQQQYAYRLETDPSEDQNVVQEVPYALRQEWMELLVRDRLRSPAVSEPAP
ncbi:MAG: sulfatase-like hydrolase/transferase [Aquimonas sp.]|nr:sulfatase-like hydrolase/transferase [Aquimonas sp.]